MTPPGPVDPAQNDGVSTWDRVRAWLRREASDVSDALDEAVDRGNADLDRREHELHATPEEKLRLEAERAAAADAEYEALRRRIEGSSDG